jgi:hypothetical protein
MMMRTLTTFLAFALVAGAAYAQTGTTTGVTGATTFLLPVRAGDTLVSLFGSSWPAVYEANRELCVAGNSAQPSPNKLITGTLLRVPSGVYLSPAVQERMDALRRQRDQVHAKLSQLATAGGAVGADAERLDQRLSDIHFVADLDSIQSATESLEQVKAAQQVAWWPPLPWWLLSMAAGLLLLAVLLWITATTGHHGPSAEARIDEALSTLEKWA